MTHFIISAELSTNDSSDNIISTWLLRQDLVNLGFSPKEMIGCYNKSIETSFMVESIDNNSQDKLMVLAKKYKQESLLRLSVDLDVWIIYPRTDWSYSERFIGQWSEISKDQAKDNYTLDIETGQYYDAR
jgi:hypothetical protein